MKRTSSPRRQTSKLPTAIDQHVGHRVRAQRLLLRMSQEKLGDALGVTFQQVQKYEKGVTRIGASRLSHMAAILGVPIPFFYEGAPSPRQTGLADDSTLNRIAGFMATKQGLHLMTTFLQIKDESIRRQLVELMSTLSMAESSARKHHARSAELLRPTRDSIHPSSERARMLTV